MANSSISLKFLHAVEGPYSTTVGWEDSANRDTYKAKQIADFILCMSLDEEQRGKAVSTATNHGLSKFEEKNLQSDVRNPEDVYSFGCVVAIAHFYNSLNDMAKDDIVPAFNKCIRAVNFLTYFLHPSKDRASRLPGPAYIARSERWKLDRAWDICICLLGAIKARCGFQRNKQFTEIPIVQPPHYLRAVKSILDRCDRDSSRLICPKGLKLLTRKEIAPFIQPSEFFERLSGVETDNNRFIHTDCNFDNCAFDTREDDNLIDLDYHVPSCKSCVRISPPSGSDTTFDSIAGSPAVNINPGNDGENWWIEADNETLAVSHVWRDGVHGTRDRGLNDCVHNLLVEIAKEVGCKSYWIDCAVIPKKESTRKSIIDKINMTFKTAKVVLCWDKGFSTVDRNPETTDTETTDLGTILLSLIVSPWHRRAWTLLEGNRANLRRMRFLQWKNNEFRLFHLKDRISAAFDPKEKVPLWIQSALVELLPYSDSNMSMDAAGLLLSGRHATRAADSSTIWGLLRPVEGNYGAKDLPFDDPYFYAINKVDVAFISSNATRFQPSNHSRCWRPKKPDATCWVRTAYGGIQAKIESDGDTRKLVCEWWVKEYKNPEQVLKNMVNWNSSLKLQKDQKTLSQLKEKTSSSTTFRLICPILEGDPILHEDPSEFASDPAQGNFRTRIFMECSRAIIVTQENNRPWQWQTMVELKENLIFTPNDMDEFTICCTNIH